MISSPKLYLGIMQLGSGLLSQSSVGRAERVTFTGRVLQQEDVTATEKLQCCTFHHRMEFCC